MPNPWERYGQPASQPSTIPLPMSPRDIEDRNRNRNNDARTAENQDFGNAQALRKEFRALPSITEYQTALGTYSSALNAKATAQGDQSLITSYAKMLDPNSVVREGEFAVTASTESTLRQIKARLAKEFGWADGGMLTDQGRGAIREEMRNLVINRFKPAYDRDRVQYQRYAQQYGFKPYEIVGDDAITQFDPKLLDPLTAPDQAPGSLAAPGSTEKMGAQIPPEYQQEHYQYLQQHWGQIDPADYSQFRSSLDEKYGLNPNPEAYSAAVPGFNALAATGGTPGQLGAVPNPTEEMGMVEGALNSAAQSPAGAFAANMGNAGAFGLPAALSGNQDKLDALRDEHPYSSFAGELAGGVTGTMGAGAGLSALGKASAFFANPRVAGSVANLGYGLTYGATQDSENPWRGAGVGVLSAAGGDMLGNAMGKAFPGLLKPRALGRAEAAVPDSTQGRQIASGLYDQAETTGIAAGPAETQDMLQRATSLLQGEGRITPKGAPIDLDSPTSRAYKLLQDWAGEPMTPKQAGTVRNILGEGRAGPDQAQARISRKLTDEFDQWADPVLPGISDARNAAERYIQGDIIDNTINLAESDASRKFSQSGLENALRSRFGALDRGIINGTERFPEPVASAIRDVARGTTGSNIARNIGKLAPTSPMAATVGPIALGAGAGAAAGAPLLGTAVGAGAAGIGAASRKLATQMAKRRAKQAVLIARDPAFAGILEGLAQEAGIRGGHVATGLFGAPASATTR